MTKDSTYAENGQQFLRPWRKSRNLTLERVADYMGAAISTISGWETGRRTMDLEDVRKLAKLYGVSPAALLISPDVADGEVSKMQLAADLAQKMPDTAAEQWIAIGKTIVGD